MKKILLTFITGICCFSAVVAQEPTKNARKKATKVTYASPSEEVAAKLKTKAAKAKAAQSANAVTFSKDPAEIQKAN